MKIGTIGAGVVALAVAKYALQAGHEVVLGSRRDPKEFASQLAQLGKGASVASVAEAAKADVVLLAVHWADVEEALAGLPDWNGRILIDATNEYLGTEPNMTVADLGGQSSSVIVAGYAPGARVVKAFSSIDMDTFEVGPRRNGGTRVLFLSGDEKDSKKLVAGLIRSFGFVAMDLGGLESGGLLQQANGSISSRDLILAR